MYPLSSKKGTGIATIINVIVAIQKSALITLSISLAVTIREHTSLYCERESLTCDKQIPWQMLINCPCIKKEPLMSIFSLDIPVLHASWRWVRRTRCGWSSVFFWLLDSRQEATVWARQLCIHGTWINNSRELVLIMCVSDTRMGVVMTKEGGDRWPGFS